MDKCILFTVDEQKGFVGGTMQVGSLVKNPYDGLIGIAVRPNTGGWWVMWSCGIVDFNNPSDLEVLCK